MVKRLILIGLVLIVGVVAWRLLVTSGQVSPTPIQTPTPVAIPTPTASCQNPSLNLQPNQEISFPFDLTVVVDNRDLNCRWIVFEAQAGMVEIRDQANVLISQGILRTTQDWMTEQPVEYRATLTQIIQPTSGQARLILTEDDPSGAGTPRQINLPLQIK